MHLGSWRGVMLALVATLAVSGVASSCGGRGDETVVPELAPPEAHDFADEWPAPNKDYANTRVASTEISSENVDELGVAWSSRIRAAGAFGVMAATPIVADGVVYTQDIASNVEAFNLETGERKWRKEYDSPTVGPNGVTIGYGKVFGATAENAFALDMETGEEVWRSQKLIRNNREGIDMAPAVFDDTVYVATVPGNTKSFYSGNGVGVLWALDAETGEEKWKFFTVPEDLWGNKEVNSGGGLWHPPGFSEDGDVYISVPNPAPFLGTERFPWGSSRPGPNLYTNTLVKLDRETGEVVWHYQAIPHDVYDWDLQLPPIVTESDGREVVVTGGKMGYVYTVDAESGELIWKTPVGRHNGHDEDWRRSLDAEVSDMPELPVTILPGILGGVETQMALEDGIIYAPVVNLATTFRTQEKSRIDLTGGGGELVALDLVSGEILWSTEVETPPYGGAIVANDLVFTATLGSSESAGKLLAFDRESGEQVWETELPAGTNSTFAIVDDTIVAPASFALGRAQTAQLVTYRLGATGTVETETQTETETGTAPGAASGEAIFSQRCGTCHVLAAAGTTGEIGPNLDQSQASLDAVVEQVANGGGGMPAFAGQLSEEEIQSVSAYVVENRDPNAEAPEGGGAGP